MQTAAMPCSLSPCLHLRSSTSSQASSVMNQAALAAKQQKHFARGRWHEAALGADRKPLPKACPGLQWVCPVLLGIASSEHPLRSQPVRTRTQERHALHEWLPLKTVVHGRLWASRGRAGTVVVCKTVCSTLRRGETKPVRQKPYQITPAKRYAGGATRRSRRPAPQSQGAAHRESGRLTRGSLHDQRLPEVRAKPPPASNALERIRRGMRHQSSCLCTGQGLAGGLSGWR